MKGEEIHGKRQKPAKRGKKAEEDNKNQININDP